LSEPVRLALLHLFQVLTDNPEASSSELVRFLKGTKQMNERSHSLSVILGLILGVGVTMGFFLIPSGPEDRCYVVWQRFYEVNPNSPIKEPQAVQTLLIKHPGQWPRNGEIGTIATAVRDGCWGVMAQPVAAPPLSSSLPPEKDSSPSKSETKSPATK